MTNITPVLYMAFALVVLLLFVANKKKKEIKFQKLADEFNAQRIADQRTIDDNVQTKSMKSAPTMDSSPKVTKELEISDEFVPEEDAWEWPKGRQLTSYNIKISLTFSYTDNARQQSRRTVDFFEQIVFSTERKFMRGICRIRGEERVFAMRKMKDIFDASTGEVIEDIFQYVKETWKNSPGIALGNWFDRNSNVLILKGISHVLRMHGHPSRKEYDVVVNMASELTGRDDFDADAIDMACNIVFPDKPMNGVMASIVKNVPDSWFLFRQTVEAIIAARGGVDLDDRRILDDLNKFENRLITNAPRDRHAWLPGNGSNNPS